MNPRKALILLESAQDYEPGCFCREPAGEILCSLFSHLHAAAHLTPPVSLSAPICGMNSPHQSPRPVIGQKCPLLKSAAGGIRLQCPVTLLMKHHQWHLPHAGPLCFGSSVFIQPPVSPSSLCSAGVIRQAPKRHRRICACSGNNSRRVLR